MSMNIHDITLSGDIADEITRLNLQQHCDMLENHLNDVESGNAHIHPDDLKLNKKIIKYSKYLLENYYGK
jgi:hypothetical protein